MYKAVLVLVVLGAVAAYVLLVGTGSHSVSDYEAVEGAPQVTLTAGRLEQDYTENEVAADRHYRDKMLEVDGIVMVIRTDPNGAPFVNLASRGRHGVHAVFQSDHGLDRLSAGVRMVMHCMGDGVYDGTPQLRACTMQ